MVCGIVAACTGELFSFLAATLAAIEHECAHAVAARKRGYSLNKVVLMPYGAVISGDISGISPKDELCVCVAGPLANAVTALFFVALWWLFPECYPYTETAAYTSLSLFLVNLLPAYPLDGGRALRVALRPLGERRAKRICTAVTLVVVAAIACLFAYSCLTSPNLSALIFAVFLLAGCFGREGYSRIQFSKSKGLLRGIEERRIALAHTRTAAYCLRFLREDKYLTLLLFDGEEFLGELSEEELFHSVEELGWDTPLAVFLK